MASEEGVGEGDWPFAVSFEQVADAQSGSPSCVDASGNLVGDFSVSGGTGEECGCYYGNFGL